MLTIKIQPGNVKSESALAFDGVWGWKLLSIAFVMLIMLAWACGFSWAEDGQDWQLKGGIGIIDRIAEDEIVIDDLFYKLAPGVIFYANEKRYTYASPSAFTVGTPVGFKLDENGEIVELWISKKG